MSKSSGTGEPVRELRAAVIPLVEDFGFDDDIYRRLAEGHSIEAVRSKVVMNTCVDKALLVRRLEWILRTCREWKLAYGQKEVLMTLAKASFLGVKAEPHLVAGRPRAGSVPSEPTPARGRRKRRDHFLT
jgi:hypothetical protein